MLERRTRTRETTTKDGYKVRRAAYSAAAEHSHKLQCSLFGKTYEPVPEIRKRLDCALNYAHSKQNETRDRRDQQRGAQRWTWMT
jgi:hypothetical protein